MVKYLVIGAYLAAIVLIVVYLIATIGQEPDDLDGVLMIDIGEWIDWAISIWLHWVMDLRERWAQ